MGVRSALPENVYCEAYLGFKLGLQTTTLNIFVCATIVCTKYFPGYRAQCICAPQFFATLTEVVGASEFLALGLSTATG